MHELPRGVALVVGVNAYRGGVKPLQSAVGDAQAIAAVLEDAHNYEVTLLLDEQASGQAVLAALECGSLRAMQEERPFLLYFAGHGVARGDGNDGPQGYLLPQDAQLSEPGSWLAMSTVRKALEALPSRHLLVVLDCCFAGAFRWAATRDVIFDAEPLYDSQFERYLKGNAWQALTSASHDELAMDVVPGHDNSRDTALAAGHSPFAAALLRGLAGEADMSRPGLEPDGVITATELYQFTFDILVPAAGKTHQTPGIWPLRNDNTGQFVFRNPQRPLNTRKDLPLNDANNPWLGLEAYSERDAPLFFGRQRCVDELLARLRDDAQGPLIAVVGASGTGKSSVVKAGVLPQLSAGDNELERWSIVRSARLSPTPMVELDAARKDLAGVSGKKLLLIDQFEELYSQCRDNDVRDQYLTTLRGLLDRGEADRVLITVRSDFEPQPAGHPALEALWSKGRYVIPNFTSAELRECIEGPANARALYFDPPELVETLVDEVMAMPGALPMLSFALAEMYRQAQRRRRETGALDRALTAADYASTGGVVGALHRRASELYDQQPKTGRASIRCLFLRMLAQDGARLSRRRVTRAELQFAPPDSAQQQCMERVIDDYVQARLLVAAADTLEPAHDTLVVAWERLQKWLSEAGPQNLIRATWRAALDWKNSQRASGVTWHDDPRLPQALSQRDQFNLLELEFVDASETVRKSRVRRLVGGAMVTIVIIAGVALIALLQRQAAIEQQEIAEQQRDRATASALLANAQAQTNPFLQARLLREIYDQDLPPPSRAAEIARDALARMRDFHAYKVGADTGNDLRRQVGINNIALQTLKSDLSKNRIYVFDSWAYEPRDYLTLDSDIGMSSDPFADIPASRPLATLAYLSNLRSVVASYRDGGFVFWPDGRDDTRRMEVDEAVALPATNASGSMVLFALDNEARVARFDDAGVPQIETLAVHPATVLSVALDRTARIAVTGAVDGRVRVWDVASGELRTTYELGAPVTQVAVGQRTGLIVAGNDHGELAAWPADGRPETVWTGRCDGAVESLSLAPAEQVIAAACSGNAHLWSADISGAGHPMTPSDGSRVDRVRVVLWPGSFDHDGLWLLGFGRGQMPLAWPVMTSAAITPMNDTGASQGFRLTGYSPEGNSVFVLGDNDSEAREFMQNAEVCDAQVVGGRLLMRDATDRVDVYDIASAELLGSLEAQDSATLTETGKLVGFQIVPKLDGVITTRPGEGSLCSRYWFENDASERQPDQIDVAMVTHDLVTGNELAATATMPYAYWPDEFSVVASANDEHFFSVASDGNFYTGVLFDLTADNDLPPQTITGQLFRHAALSPDGKQLLIAADRMNPNIFHDDPKLYATTSLDQPWRVLGGQDFVRYAAFSADGQSLVTIDCQGHAYVWNTDGSGDPIVVRVQEEKDGAFCGPMHDYDSTPLEQAEPRAWFSEDSNYLRTQIGDAEVQSWPIRFDALIPALKGGTYLCLTAQQREQFFSESLEVARAAYNDCMAELGIKLVEAAE